MTITDDGRVAI